jgi:hypothetical protein
MFLIVIFTIAKTWTQSRCYQLADKENVVYVYNRILLSIKQNEIMSLGGKWVELEIIMLSKISQTEKVNHMFSLIHEI